MKNKKYLFKFSLILTLSSILIASCNKNFLLKEINIFGFNTILTIQSYGLNNEDLINKKDELMIKDKIDLYSKYFDAFNEYPSINNIYTINHSNEFIKIDKFLFDALKEARYLYQETYGYFNPYLGELTFKYKKAYEEYSLNGEENKKLNLPTSNEINDALNNLKTFNLEFNEEKLEVKRNGDSLIDLGAFAKGYLLFNLEKIFNELNYKYYLINAGKSSSLLKSKPDQSEFLVKIKYLNKKGIKIKDSSLGVSSIFEQYVSYQNKIYSHIIDPFLGVPVSYYDFTVVQSLNPIISDVLSTVLMLIDDINLINEFKNKFNFEYLLYKNNNLIHSSNGIKLVETI